MADYLPFHVPDIDDDDIDAVVGVLRSGWLTTGGKARQFEQEFAAKVGARYAVALNSCTAALHLALDAIGLSEGDEVLVPTMTFAASAEVVTYFKAKPVLVDCVPTTLNIDPDLIERAITPRTKAVIPVHFAGQPCDMARILEIARHHNLRVIEDAAHAFPASYKGKMIGSIGDCTCFSFYATKNITTGEGGMVTTDDPEWADRMRRMSLHGLSRDAWKRYTNQGSWHYDIVAPGFKYNLTDMAAALGLSQLHKAERFWKTRERYAALYTEGFRDLPEIAPLATQDEVQHGWHLYVIRLDTNRLHFTREQFVERLQHLQIGCSVHFIPLHLHTYYRRTGGYRPEDFPVASRAFEGMVSLPLYSKMSESDVRRTIAAVRALVLEGRQ